MAFTPDGKIIAVGLIQGQVFFYDSNSESFSLTYKTQLECRNRQGTYYEGRKVTNMVFLEQSQGTRRTLNISAVRNSSDSSATINSSMKKKNKNASGALYLLVSTNDNRIRIFSMSDYSMLAKYKNYSYLNSSMQIKANISYDGKYIISGSDTGKVFLWPSNLIEEEENHKVVVRKKSRSTVCEIFDGIGGEFGVATCAVFIPEFSLAYLKDPNCNEGINISSTRQGILTTDSHGCIRVFISSSNSS